MSEKNGYVSMKLFLAALAILLAAMGFLYSTTVPRTQFAMVCERLDRIESQTNDRFDRVDDRLTRLLERRDP